MNQVSSKYKESLFPLSGMFQKVFKVVMLPIQLYKLVSVSLQSLSLRHDYPFYSGNRKRIGKALRKWEKCAPNVLGELL